MSDQLPADPHPPLDDAVDALGSLAEIPAHEDYCGSNWAGQVAKARGYIAKRFNFSQWQVQAAAFAERGWIESSDGHFIAGCRWRPGGCVTEACLQLCLEPR